MNLSLLHLYVCVYCWHVMYQTYKLIFETICLYIHNSKITLFFSSFSLDIYSLLIIIPSPLFLPKILISLTHPKITFISTNGSTLQTDEKKTKKEKDRDQVGYDLIIRSTFYQFRFNGCVPPIISK